MTDTRVIDEQPPPPVTDSLAVHVRDLRMSYGSTKVLRGVDFDVRYGEVFCLLGPNGAGKTTTLEILEGFRPPTGGTVRVLGLNPATQAARLRERAGMVLQECGFPRQARVAELIDTWRSYYPNPRPLAELLDVVELAEVRNTQVRKLSGGLAGGADRAGRDHARGRRAGGPGHPDLVHHALGAAQGPGRPARRGRPGRPRSDVGLPHRQRRGDPAAAARLGGGEPPRRPGRPGRRRPQPRRHLPAAHRRRPVTRSVRLAARQALLEQRSFWRSTEYALFTFAFPLMILLLIGAANVGSYLPGTHVKNTTVFVPSQLPAHRDHLRCLRPHVQRPAAVAIPPGGRLPDQGPGPGHAGGPTRCARSR